MKGWVTQKRANQLKRRIKELEEQIIALQHLSVREAELARKARMDRYRLIGEIQMATEILPKYTQGGLRTVPMSVDDEIDCSGPHPVRYLRKTFRELAGLVMVSEIRHREFLQRIYRNRMFPENIHKLREQIEQFLNWHWESFDEEQQ